MAKKLGIIAYGTPEDRVKLEAVAKAENRSASSWIIQKIREEFKKVYGHEG